MNVLITGACGFLGTHLTRYLLNHGYEVEGVDNYAHPIANLDWHPKLPIKADVSKPDWYTDKDMQELIGNCDVIVHLAATINVDFSVAEPKDTLYNNINGVINTLEACRRHDLKMIFASTCETYGSNLFPEKPMNEQHPLHPHSPYGASKLAGEILCQTYRNTYGLKVNILRPFNIFGIYQNSSSYGGVIMIFLKQILSNQSPTVFGDGKQTRDYTDVSDVIRAYEIAINEDFGGKPLNFGSGKQVTINSLAYKLIKLCGKEGKIKPTHIIPSPRVNELRFSWCDFKQAHEMFGWKPEVTLDEGLKKVVGWYRKVCL
jgi:nucleoside-diphosphate-sugar epimerase